MRKIALTLAVALGAASLASVAAADQTTDRAAAQTIARNLKTSGQMKDYRVGVKYQDGVAWLLGTVTSEQQKAIAQEVASNTEGVEKVICKLEIVAPEPELPLVEPASREVPVAASEPAELETATMQAFPTRAAETIGQAPMPTLARPSAMPRRSNMPVPYATRGPHGVQPASYGNCPPGMGMGGPPQGMGGMPQGMGMGGPQPMPMSHVPSAPGRTVSYDNPQMPGYAWPSYAAYPNYAALTYPQQYSPSAWPYIGPFYPYPQVPLGWRKVALEWDDGWWFLDFSDCKDCH